MRNLILKFFSLLTIILLVNSCKPNLGKSHNPTQKELQRSQGSLVTKVVTGGRIWSLDWSPDGKYIACGTASGLLRIYRSDNLELVQILTGFKGTINGIHWSPDGKK